MRPAHHVHVNEVISVSTYRYEGVVLVELVGRDAHGEPLAISYEFDAGPDDATLHPREGLAEDHVTPITDALAADGYTVERQPP